MEGPQSTPQSNTFIFYILKIEQQKLLIFQVFILNDRLSFSFRLSFSLHDDEMKLLSNKGEDEIEDLRE